MDITHATPELFAALAAAQGEIENAAKGSVNPHFRSKYADLAEVLNTIRPVFSRHGLALIQGTSFDGSMVYVTTVIAHASGGSISTTAAAVPAKSDPQGVGSCTTYLRRYGAAACAGVAQEDLDGEDSKHDKKPVAVIGALELKTLQALCTDTGTDPAQFAAWLGVKSLYALPVTEYERAERSLLAKQAKQKEAVA